MLKKLLIEIIKLNFLFKRIKKKNLTCFESSSYPPNKISSINLSGKVSRLIKDLTFLNS